MSSFEFSYSNTYTGNGARHLLDDSLLEHVTSPIVRPSVTSSKDGSMNGMSIGEKPMSFAHPVDQVSKAPPYI